MPAAKESDDGTEAACRYWRGLRRPKGRVQTLQADSLMTVNGRSISPLLKPGPTGPLEMILKVLVQPSCLVRRTEGFCRYCVLAALLSVARGFI